MRIIGVDPGLTRCGVGVIELAAGRSVRFIDVQVVRSSAGESIEQRLLRIGHGVAELLERHQPDALAMERVFSRKDTTTVMATAHASGVVMFQAARAGIPVTLHTPTEVKAAVTGYGAAEKAQVGTMTARLLGLEEVPKPADAADALAIAICHAFRAAGTGAAGLHGLAAPERETGVDLTPAQKAWRAAEASAAKGNGGRILKR